MMGESSPISSKASLCPCGTNSRRTRPAVNSVPAGRPPSLATIATLSLSCMRTIRGETGCEADGTAHAPSVVQVLFLLTSYACAAPGSDCPGGARGGLRGTGGDG